MQLDQQHQRFETEVKNEVISGFHANNGGKLIVKNNCV